MRKILISILLLILSTDLAVAGGKKEVPPDVLLNMESETAVSPVTSFNSQDKLELLYSVAPAEGKTITIVQLAITDPEGSVVWNYDKVPPKEKGVPFSESVIWDGTNASGAYVDSGTYLLQAVAWDSNEIFGQSGLKQITVDNIVPEVSVSLPYKVFSPNNDGRKDFLVIEQDGSSERLWNGEIKNDSGEVVTTKQWTGRSPDNFIWDATNLQGNIVPDGTYTYTIVSTDAAGNRAEKTVRNIVIDTTATKIGLTRSLGSFSPNGDGVKDTLAIDPAVNVTSGIKEWTLAITDSNGNARWKKNGTDVPPTVTYHGKNADGNILENGRYTAVLSILYRNGNKPEASTKPFVLDTQKPRAELSVNYDIFSPDGDKDKDKLIITHNTSEENKWEGKIVDQKDNTIKKFSWRGTPPGEVSWNGRNSKGNLVPNGNYTYILTATDKAGNKAVYETKPFEKKMFDTSDISISKDKSYFSPNDDGTKETIDFAIEIKGEEELELYSFTIANTSGGIKYTEEGNTVQERTITWDGTSDEGKQLPDGEYTATLQAVYASGDEPSLTTEPFYIDTKKPEISLSTNDKVFSPNGDGRKDSVIIQQDSSGEDVWEAVVKDDSGNTVMSTYWKGEADNFTWNGKDQEGRQVEDGTYTYTVSAVDNAGNSVSKTIGDIQVETKSTPIYVSLENEALSPDGDGIMDSVYLNLYAEVTEGIESWQLTILPENGTKAIKSFAGDGPGPLPESVEWKGTNNQEKTAPEGNYVGVFTITYKNGNKPEETTESAVLLDVSDPELTVNITPKPFSPDGDGMGDNVTIDVEAMDNNTLASWTGEIYDPAGNLFYQMSGEGAVDKAITWDGKAKDGELVQAASNYTLKITTKDLAGNKTVSEKVIPVDVFLIHEGDKARIQISSIIFPPDSPDHTAVDKQQRRKNKKVLDRLAEVLKKYDEYKIRIEGHAVVEYWKWPGAADWEQENVLIPLSRNRAESVKNALVARGVKESRLSVKGFGGDDPVVPHSNIEQRWKNRRVEFILTER